MQQHSTAAARRLARTTREDEIERKELVTKYLTPADIRPLFRFMGEHLSEEELNLVLSEMDIDCDGRVDLEDFWRSMLVRKDLGVFTPEFTVDNPFRAFDSDGDGVISLKDMQHARAALGHLFPVESSAEMIRVLETLNELSAESIAASQANNNNNGSSSSSNQGGDSSVMGPTMSVLSKALPPKASPGIKLRRAIQHTRNQVATKHSGGPLSPGSNSADAGGSETPTSTQVFSNVMSSLACDYLCFTLLSSSLTS